MQGFQIKQFLNNNLLLNSDQYQYQLQGWLQFLNC